MRSALFVATFCLLCLASFVAAAPLVSIWGSEGASSQTTSSWFGNVGMIVTPTANTPRAGGATVGFHHVDFSGGPVNAINVNFGVTDWLEVGGTYLDQPGGPDTIGNVKVQLPVHHWLLNAVLPEIAVGAFDITNEINRALYVVLSKSFSVLPLVPGSPRVGLHLGLADNALNGGRLDGLFGGIEFKALRYGLVQAEWDGFSFNADLRYHPIPPISLDVGILDGDLGYGATYSSRF